MAFRNLINDRAVFADIAAIHNIRPVLPDNRLVGRDFNDIQFVDCGKFLRLGYSGTGHSRQLLVQAEIILEGNGSQRLVLFLNINVFLGLNCLMQAFGVPAPEHQAARKLVHDDDLAVFDDIVDIALHDAVGTQRLVNVMAQRGIFHIGQILKTEGTFRFRDAPCRQCCGPRLFIHHVVGIQLFAFLFLFVNRRIDDFFQPANEIIGLAVEIRTLIALPGDDQRGPGFINQD